MMKSSLTPEHYTSNSITQREFETVFRKLWLFAGFKCFLKSPREYITRIFADVPIVITHTSEGKIVAFENQCPHRQMPLFSDDFGKKTLFCPYHGWSFNDDGSLLKIPNPEVYDFTSAECEKLHLRPIACEVIGAFIFVNLSANPIPIEHQFNRDLLNNIVEVSSHLGEVIGYTKFLCSYNWKLNFENVKDWNHVAFLHAKSFAPLLKTETITTKNKQEQFQTPSLQTNLASNEPVVLPELSYRTSSPMLRNKPWYDDLLERYGSEDRYYNWFLYPNINFTSIHGELFQVQQYNPISAGVTEYHLWVLTAKTKVDNLNVVPLVDYLLKMEKATIEEDRVFLELLQTGLHNNSSTAVHGKYERHIKRMNDWYADFIENGVL